MGKSEWGHTREKPNGRNRMGETEWGHTNAFKRRTEWRTEWGHTNVFFHSPFAIGVGAVILQLA